MKLETSNAGALMERALLKSGCDKITENRFSLSIFPDIVWNMEIYRSRLVEAEMFFDMKSAKYSIMVMKVYNKLLGALPHHAGIKKLSKSDGFYRRSVSRIDTGDFPILGIENSLERVYFQINSFENCFLDLARNIKSLEQYFHLLIEDRLPFTWKECNSVGRAVEISIISVKENINLEENIESIYKKIEWRRFGFYPDNNFNLMSFVRDCISSE